MTDLSLALDPAWAAGFVLALTRMGMFVTASPMLSKAVPMPGRMALSVVLGFFFAEPVSSALDVGGLIGAAVANAAVGIVLAFLTGMLFHLFAVAGSLIDVNTGLSAASLFDPITGHSAAVFSRLFSMTAVTIFVAVGGLDLLVRGLGLSFAAIPLDGSLSPHEDLMGLAVGLLGQMVVAAIQLTLPVLAALFLAEIVLGLAARFAPQMNLFLVGLPAKILLAMSLVGVSLLLFPHAIQILFDSVRDTFGDGLRGLTAV